MRLFRALFFTVILAICGDSVAAPIIDITFAGGAGVARLGVAGEAPLSPAAVFVADDSRITVVATQSVATQGNRLVIERLVAGGDPDAAFGVQGRINLPGIHYCVQRPAISALDSGRIIVLVPASDTVDCSTTAVHGWIVAADGRFDTLAVELPASSRSHPIATTSDGTGKTMVVASFDGPSGGETDLSRMTSSGVRDPTFSATGRVALDSGASVDNRDGRVVPTADGLWLTAVMSGTKVKVARWTRSGVPVAFGDGSITAIADFDTRRPGDSYRLVDAFRVADGANLLIVGIQSSGFGTFRIGRGAGTSSGFAQSSIFSAPGPIEWPAAVTMDDATTIIAENVGAARHARLRRLFPNASFDLSWGVDSAFAVGDDLSITAMTRDGSGKLVLVGTNANGGFVQRLVLNLQPNATANFATEYHNDVLDHYFITTSLYEEAAIERGEAGPGWRKTGFGFRAFAIPGTVPPGTVPVCRFYGNRAIDPQSGQPAGPNSHVYVPEGPECDAVKRDKGWIFEGIAFYIHLPVAGQCGFGKNPIRRFYNGRFAENDSNHRYTTSAEEGDAMVRAGWRDEGVVMCEQFTIGVVPGT